MNAVTLLPEKIREKIPLNRFGTTSEIFAALQYILNPEASYMTGQVMHINGGLYL